MGVEIVTFLDGRELDPGLPEVLNLEQQTPKYVKIKDYILNMIRSGVYRPGSKIPTEKELAEKFSVSRITANKALKELAVAGVLTSVRGSGTFVKEKQATPIESRAFVSTVKFDPIDQRCHQLVSFRLMKGAPPLSEKMGTALGQDLNFYEIILINKGLEHNTESLDYIYFPAALVEDSKFLNSLDYLSNHFVCDYLKEALGLAPAYMKIFVNTPLYPFLESARELLKDPKHLQIWCTDIFDADMGLLCAVYTLCPDVCRDVPLFTFAL